MNNDWLTIEREGERVILKKCSQEAEGKVVIPDGVTEIADLAFSSCNKVNDVIIPNGVNSIGMNAFIYCDLTSIHIPASVTRFVPYTGGIIITCPFYGNPNITSITVDKNNPVYDSRNNCNAIIEKSSNRLILGCRNTVIPKSVIIIGNASFFGLNEPVEIPEEVKVIESYAFYYCNFRSIVIPKHTKICYLSMGKHIKVIRGQNMISYLSKYREETPTWLENYLRGEKITLKDIMSSRVAYYPGSGYDGTLMKVGNKSHAVHSFLYVDYMLKRKDLDDHIAQENSILGYHPIGQIEWHESDLMPNGQYPIDFEIRSKHAKDGNPNTLVDLNEKPYCFSLILERNEDQNETRGAKHFVVTFLFADGIATYYQLFVKEYAKAPWLFLLQDHGFGCNYDSFGRGGILDEIIQKAHCYPRFVICGHGGGTRIWNGYEKVQNVAPENCNKDRGYHGANDFRDLYQFVDYKRNE